MWLEIEFKHMANDSIKHAYIMKARLKTLNGEAQRASWIVNILTFQQGGTPYAMGTKLPSPHPPALILGCVSNTWLILSCILYNKPVIVKYSTFREF